MMKASKSNSTKAQGAPQKKQQNIYVLLGITAGIFVVLIGLFLLIQNMMTSSDQPQQTSSYQDEKTANIAKAKKVPSPEGSQGGNSQASNQGDSNSSNQNFNGSTTSNRELKITTDPQSGVDYVETPSGTVLVSSPEGQKYIQDFKAYKMEENGGVDPSAANIQVSALSSQSYQNEINTLKAQINEQAQALDEKINTSYENQENMQAIIDKQNETIQKLSQNLAMAQPLMRSPKEIAKELFGKQAEATLKSRNNAVKLDSVVGNKGYFTDKDGNVHFLGVGDIIPNTSLMIKAFDEGRGEAIVYK
ncbi:hypothetical protein A7M79_07195 [Acinetobacter baumannii]|uniref:hypothetical protein n=1 Tax=Acinetobacter baumannii TaxID=470 RepID=UPI0008DCCC9B|nr:hypothetical protein [Acinetobacter baumannii]OIH08592.1 hypothetical protein A7M79_07195 [Acinetobacter baumannii]